MVKKNVQKAGSYKISQEPTSHKLFVSFKFYKWCWINKCNKNRDWDNEKQCRHNAPKRFFSLQTLETQKQRQLTLLIKKKRTQRVHTSNPF